MSVFTRVLSVLGLILLVGFNGCATDVYSEDDCPAPIDPNKPGNTRLFFSIKADEHLNASSKLAILAAINEWAESTGFTVEYNLSFIDMSQVKDDLKTRETIYIYAKDPGPGYVGWAEWIKYSDGISAHILVEPNSDYENFRKIMLHELGHVFGLTFVDKDGKENIHYQGTCPSVMYPSIGQSSNNLGCPELNKFCELYGCSVSCDEKTTAKGQSEMKLVVSPLLTEEQFLELTK